MLNWFSAYAIIVFLSVGCAVIPQSPKEVKIVYDRPNTEFLFVDLNSSKIPDELQTCKNLGRIDDVHYNGEHFLVVEELYDALNNQLKNNASKLGGNTVLPIKRFRNDYYSYNGEFVYQGVLSGIAFDCPKKLKICSLPSDCTYKNVDHFDVSRHFLGMKNEDKLTFEDEMIKAFLVMGNDGFNGKMTIENKTNKKIILNYGQNNDIRGLIFFGDPEIDPYATETFKFHFAEITAPIWKVSTTSPGIFDPTKFEAQPFCGKFVGGKVDDRLCVAQEQKINLKYRRPDGTRGVLRMQYRLAARVQNPPVLIRNQPEFKDKSSEEKPGAQVHNLLKNIIN